MHTMFLICAILGSTIVVCQFLLTLTGLGGDHGDFDAGAHTELGHDPGSSEHPVDQADDHASSHGSTWLFGILTFRAVVTFLAFFGLAGLAANSASWPPVPTIMVAFAAGCAAVYVVRSIFRSFHYLRADGTVQIERTIGLPATVYLNIPAENKGWGKVTLVLQNRTMEYEASTSEQKQLNTGTQVVVTRVLGPDRLEVTAA